MSSVLLRTLTRKSIIGFGHYKDLSVQNLIDLFKHKELLSIYYTCRNIDFCQDLKDELYISGEREINKKIPQAERYLPNANKYMYDCLNDIIGSKSKKELRAAILTRGREKRTQKKHREIKEKVIDATVFGKSAQRNRNQNSI